MPGFPNVYGVPSSIIKGPITVEERKKVLGDLAAGPANPAAQPPLNAEEAASPTVPDNGDADIPPEPGIPGSDEGGQDSSEGTGLGIAAREYAFPRMPVNLGPGGEVVYGENYSNLLGPEGKNAFQDAFVNIPKKINQALDAGAEAQSAEGTATKDVLQKLYEQQSEDLASMKAKRLQEQAEIQHKQQEIEKATQYYTNDLADTGKFWARPGSIFAAIGAVLMGLGSAPGSNTTYNVLNGAIQADWLKRKELADMHLGDMRGNLDKYRQIAGDRDTGDRLALAESYRVANIELQRIAAQFQGPIAKAKAAAIGNELNQKFQMLMMQVYQSAVLTGPKAVDPRIAAALKAGGQAMPGVGYTPFKQPGAANATGGQAPSGMGPTSSVGPGMTGQPAMPGNGPEWEMSESDKKRYNDRSPGAGDELESEQKDAVKRIWSISGGNPKKFNDEMEKFERLQEADLKEISKQGQQANLPSRIRGMRRLGHDIGVMQNLANQVSGGDVDKLLNTFGDVTMGKSFQAKWSDVMNAMSGPARTKWEKQKHDVEDSVQRFKQLLAGEFNAYIKQESGATVNPNEEARNMQYLRNGFRGIKVYHDNESEKSEAELNNITNSQQHPVTGTLYRIQMGLNTPKLNQRTIPAYNGWENAPTEHHQSVRKPSPKEENVKKAIKKLKGE